MGEEGSKIDLIEATNSIRNILKSQYHAALATLKETIELCPDDIWSSQKYTNSFWQSAYHALFFAHLYIQTEEAAFVPWKKHQSNVQYQDGIAGPPEPDSTLELLPKPYTKAEILEYCDFCDQIVDDSVDAIDVHSSESGFSWYKVPKLEHQLVNIRHIQHHAAQLADRLRNEKDIGIKWVGATKINRT